MYDDTFYINNNTILCPKTYRTDKTGVYIQMNGSYTLDCNVSDTFEAMISTSGDLIGILNHYDDVTIKNCNFVGFTEGVVSTPDPATVPVENIAARVFIRYLSEVMSEEELDPFEAAFNSMGLYNFFIDSVSRNDELLYYSYYLFGSVGIFDTETYEEFYRNSINPHLFNQPLNNGQGLLLYDKEGIKRMDNLH